MTSGELWVVEGKQYTGKWVPIPLWTFTKQEEAAAKAEDENSRPGYIFTKYRAVRYVREEE